MVDSSRAERNVSCSTAKLYVGSELSSKGSDAVYMDMPGGTAVGSKAAV